MHTNGHEDFPVNSRGAFNDSSLYVELEFASPSKGEGRVRVWSFDEWNDRNPSPQSSPLSNGRGGETAKRSNQPSIRRTTSDAIHYSVHAGVFVSPRYHQWLLVGLCRDLGARCDIDQARGVS